MRTGQKRVPTKTRLEVTFSFLPPWDVLLSLSFSRSAFKRLLPHLPDLKSFNVWSVLKSSFGPLSGTRDTDVVLDFFGLRGVDASLGQIAVRNRSFPEMPAFGEPLMRHYFCFWPEADLRQAPINVCLLGKSRHYNGRAPTTPKQ